MKRGLFVNENENENEREGASWKIFRDLRVGVFNRVSSFLNSF